MTQKQGKHKKRQRQLERVEAAKRRQRIRLIMILTIVVLILAGGFGIYYASSGSGGSATDQSVKGDSPVFAYDTQPVLGDPDAPVKIVELGDYKCPVCQLFDATFFPKIKKDFIETGKAAYYFMNYPIIEGSIPAALASESVYHNSPDLFWDYHDAIYANQGPEDEDWATTEFLVQLAKKHVPEIDTEQLKKDIEEKTYLDQIRKEQQKGESLGVQGTPTIFVNGEMLDWEHTSHYPKLKAKIQEAYEKAVASNGKS
ncbi:MAG TPA: thioredoxin domain-containing protein [Bacillales bacterium]